MTDTKIPQDVIDDAAIMAEYEKQLALMHDAHAPIGNVICATVKAILRDQRQAVPDVLHALVKDWQTGVIGSNTLCLKLCSLVSAAPSPPCERTESACNMTAKDLPSNTGNQFYDYEVVGDDLVLTPTTPPPADANPEAGEPKGSCAGASLKANNGEAVACNVEGSWLWRKLMEWCKKRHVSPANYDDLFEIAGEAHKLFTHSSTSSQAPDVAERMHEMRKALDTLLTACEESNDCQYGTLSTSFVADICRQVLAKAGGHEMSLQEGD